MFIFDFDPKDIFVSFCTILLLLCHLMSNIKCRSWSKTTALDIVSDDQKRHPQQTEHHIWFTRGSFMIHSMLNHSHTHHNHGTFTRAERHMRENTSTFHDTMTPLSAVTHLRRSKREKHQTYHVVVDNLLQTLATLLQTVLWKHKNRSQSS